ncbi:hypothetical protein EV126DRAFT_342322 [Verticillium dahliae]|nr:hypothetical protein EV126DRAFT_342322 [Verticillium dahliae]
MSDEAHQQITATEVSEASALRRAGHQQLRRISDKVSTCFAFNVPLYSPECGASVIIEVKPIVRGNSCHPLYDIRARCETCLPGEQVDGFVKTVQEVYDTYIQAVRWTFDQHCFGPESNCLQHAQCSLSAPEEGVVATPLLCEPFHTSRIEPTRTFAAVISATPSAGNKRISPSEVRNIGRPKKRSKSRQTVDQIIRGLVSTISEGLKGLHKKEMISFDQLNMHRVFSKCLEANLSSDLLDQLLLTLSSEFKKEMKQGTLMIWSDWYFAACLQYARCRTGIKERDHDQDRSSTAIYVLHSIVNNLLFSDGINALSVIYAFAARGQILSAAAHRTLQEQDVIIETVTQEFRRRLHPPEWYGVPVPVVWIGLILKLR